MKNHVHFEHFDCFDYFDYPPSLKVVHAHNDRDIGCRFAATRHHDDTKCP
jgi:hypothetical protein